MLNKYNSLNDTAIVNEAFLKMGKLFGDKDIIPLALLIKCQDQIPQLGKIHITQ